MSFFSTIYWIILGYLSGSLVWGYWIGKFFYGIDLRNKGSGNIGATNVFRVLGPVPGIFTFVLDVLKGALPVILVKNIYAKDANQIILATVGIAAIIGSKFSLFLRGKGGKSVNCSFGVILAMMPVEAIFSLVVWLGIFTLTGYVSLASIAAATALPFLILILQKNMPLIFIGILIFIVVIFAHRDNIKRLIEGKENRFSLWKK
ncbi:MAG TPA: glycerol-3-phosphate 1-O-acyltransferase PlsY [bacterium]|nr:glycerol-3-phosphate 1-O-acyltransferase PlsY [bacterium]HOL48972.1 glycerol-3-phosphate 1-O-acyltransferase PlsY [bacterium]HPO51350.1 glycerol-3-phosphate 1-O-acyltransferase PlsY [bacterium]HXK44978.1 glycerol-3-phosphate 1-O-acyltransferase PlsY [bacterium]